MNTKANGSIRSSGIIETDEYPGVEGEETLLRIPISSESLDRDEDRFSERGLQSIVEQVRAEMPPIRPDHNYMEWDDQLGTQLDAELEGDVVYAYVRPNLATEQGRKMLEMAQAGQALRFSAGFAVNESEELDDDGRLFHDVDIVEASAVSIQSNPDAVFLRAKSASAEDGTVTLEIPSEQLKSLEEEKALPQTFVEENRSLLVPREGVAEAARECIECAEDDEDFSAGSDELLPRARQLVDHYESDEPLGGSNEEGTPYWVEIENYHDRMHAQDVHLLEEDNPCADNGYISHQGWGGDEGYEQAQEVTDALDDFNESSQEEESDGDNMDEELKEKLEEMRGMIEENKECSEETRGLVQNMYEENSAYDGGDDDGDGDDDCDGDGDKDGDSEEVKELREELDELKSQIEDGEVESSGTEKHNEGEDEDEDNGGWM